MARNVDGIDVEAIVREVIAQLQAGNEKQQPAAEQSTPAGQLEISEKLVTLATLENRLSEVRHLVVRRDAVVTPAVRDALRERNIVLSHAAGKVKKPVELVLGAAELDRAGAAALATLTLGLTREGIAIQRVAETGLASVVSELAGEAARGGRPAVLFSSRPEAAACLANRQRGVRAVGSRDLAGLRRAIHDVAANLVAVDPSREPQAAVALVREFCDGWPRAVPDLFAGEQR